MKKKSEAKGIPLTAFASQRTSKRHLEIKKIKSHQKARVLRKYNKILKEVGREQDIDFVPYHKRQSQDEPINHGGEDVMIEGKDSKKKKTEGGKKKEKKLNPAEEAHKRYLELQEQRELERKQIEEERMKAEQEKAKKLKQKSFEKKKHMERTQRGQPVMKNILDGILKKIQK
eukprot:TRINITY_DN6658_c0_g1_i4.p3 TRINITY_DN6658_c0_g1~~TRINITY_DN6658_c0_g1_i4.p3  ORF type:complete len:173 (+),score=60.59 TRINITY_DN6658_c0_g1_i4:50-568(+)